MNTIVLNADLIRVVEDLTAKRIIKKNVDIVKATGYSAGIISNYLTGKTLASKNFIQTFEKVFKVSISAQSDYEMQKSDTPQTRGVEEEKKPYHKRRLEDKLNDKEETIMFYEVNASAGTANSADIMPVNKGEGVLHISDLFKGSQYAIRIAGNSMMPNYPPGAIIGIREIQDKFIVPGSVYVVQKENDLWIKRLFYKDNNQDLGIVNCISDNTMKFEMGEMQGKPAYPAFHIKMDEISKLFKVTGIYKPNELSVIN